MQHSPRSDFKIILEWPSQSPDLNPIEHLWRDLKMTVQRCSKTNLMELLQRWMGETAKIDVPIACSNIFRQTWGYNCCFNKVLSKGCVYHLKVIFLSSLFIFRFAKMLTTFTLSLHDIVCRMLRIIFNLFHFGKAKNCKYLKDTHHLDW